MKGWSWALCVITALLASCATVRSGVDKDAEPNATTAVIFGRSEFFLDGEPSWNDAVIAHHLARFMDVAHVTRSKYVPGEISILAYVRDNGWFAANVPPGRYYFVEYDYDGFDLGTSLLPNLIGIRSYMDISFGADPKVPHPFLTFVDLAPGKATYIGSLRHQWVTESAAEDPDFNLLSWSLAVHDERVAAQAWLAKNYPKWSRGMVTRLAESRPVDP